MDGTGRYGTQWAAVRIQRFPYDRFNGSQSSESRSNFADSANIPPIVGGFIENCWVDGNRCRLFNVKNVQLSKMCVV